MLSEILHSLSNWSANIILSFGYPGIAFISLVENIVTPIPSEAVLPFAGFLSIQGELNIWLIAISATLGSLIGALIIYWFGLYGKETFVRKFIRKYGKWFFVDEKSLDSAEEFFIKHGMKAIFFGRLIPIVRSLISLPAGFAKINIMKFIIFTSLGTFIWSFILVYAGVLLGENWELVGSWLKKYEFIALGGLGVAVVFFIYYQLRSRKKS